VFNAPLADLLNPRHALYQLANFIAWKILEEAFGQFFTAANGVT